MGILAERYREREDTEEEAQQRRKEVNEMRWCHKDT